MPANDNWELQTKRLILREYREEDFQSIHEYGSDPEVVKYLPFGPNTEQDTQEFIRQVLASQKEQPRNTWDTVLVTKDGNHLIGACSLRITSADDNEGEIGYVLHRQYWNQGYMSEAARRIIEFGFKELGLHRIYACCDPANAASYRVMEKIGMQREGLLRENKLVKGTWRDSLLYSILEKEGEKG